MVELKRIDWESAFKRQPKRYLKVFDKDTNELVEVHDTDTGNVWIKINNEWMHID